ncbi:arginase NDAI_0E02530 [Naumovozyma dairenensis CBS 421]|uniref:Arginase n=1 Tax=Naumovozyma dairenensis (strain ATCC 10597 / BCRC 20456 / CBS 421 / NBRC 0211 / NRRL Y-12639) TaxID=1071378 RepID=G0WBF0_NAUDC|nr:hypothetical protein NDAI_0E02530 [Naumovozyma dairenensis CBS 421]CCD25070.1 hypothetical protein NDAI_0E02530 [Naumovozyma dairenensis CBS 421]
MTVTTAPSYKYYESQRLSIITAPFSGGQSRSGVEKGPKYMLNHGLQNSLTKLGWSTVITEPLSSAILQIKKDEMDQNDRMGIVKRPNLVGKVTKLIYETVTKSLSNERFPLTLGGDHSIAMGTVSAVIDKFPDAGLLWIDAHADINTLTSTDSGNLHGCPVSFLMGLNDKKMVPESMEWIPGNLKPNKIAYIGLRDIDEGEKKILKNLGIAAFSMYHVDRLGINEVIEMAMRAIHPETNGDGPIMCSYDVDALDPLYVPATGTPVRGGLTLREGLFLVERLAETGNLVGLDIVEVNPDLASKDDHVSDTIATSCSIARCALGETLL